jgi:pyruvate formate lyase activating enzyme
MKIRRIVPNSLIDYPKHVSMVIFLEGCNFNCDFCFVKELLKEGHGMTKEVMQKLKERKDFIDGVVITGGEPTINKRLHVLLREIKEEVGLPVRLYTNGSNPLMIDFLIRMQLIDSIAVDIKGRLDNDDYKTIAKNDCAEKVKQSIKIIKESGIDYEFRVVMIPTRTEEDISKIEEYTGKVTRMVFKNVNDEAK